MLFLNKIAAVSEVDRVIWMIGAFAPVTEQK